MPLQSRRLRREFPDDSHRQDKVESLIYVDDRTLTRDCVAGQLAAWLPEFSVTAVASYSEIGGPPFDERNCSILCNTHALRVEDVEFLHNLPAMQRAAPALRVAVLSDLEARDNIVAALRHGVNGYLLTSLSLRIASEVIRLIHAGGTFVPSSAVLDTEMPAFPEQKPASAAPKLRGFTRRQVEVLKQLRDGKQNKAIAFELKMSESTVKVHLHHIMQKLQATNRMQVILQTRQLFEEHRPATGSETATDGRCATEETVSATWPMDLTPRRGEATFWPGRRV
jgi:DNA-binding NarL/FixJ family response regulator